MYTRKFKLINTDTNDYIIRSFTADSMEELYDMAMRYARKALGWPDEEFIQVHEYEVEEEPVEEEPVNDFNLFEKY